MQLEDLKAQYDKLQVKYGAEELTSVYNGGCTNNPDICFAFMNPTDYPIEKGMMNIEKAIEDIKFIIELLKKSE